MIHVFWLKKLTSLYYRLVQQMEKLVIDGDHPCWLTQGRTVLVKKDPDNGPAPSNYRPISGIVADKIQDHMNGYMHLAQKGIGGGSKGAKHQLLIGQAVQKTQEIGVQTWQWHGLTTARHVTHDHTLGYLKV